MTLPKDMIEMKEYLSDEDGMIENDVETHG